MAAQERALATDGDDEAGERMSPASPIRTMSAADSDQPASSRGLTSGPDDENARADATAMTMPLVRAVARRLREAAGSAAGVRISSGAVCVTGGPVMSVECLHW